MEFKSISDILRFAISKEEASAQFYSDLSVQMKDTSTRALFEVLSRTEFGHVEALQLELNKQGYTVDPQMEMLDSEFEWDERLELDEEARDMNFLDALLVAIQKERAAFKLYVHVLSRVHNEQFANVLMELAEEEMRHVLQLEEEYKAIVHRKD